VIGLKRTDDAAVQGKGQAQNPRNRAVDAETYPIANRFLSGMVSALQFMR